MVVKKPPKELHMARDFSSLKANVTRFSQGITDKNPNALQRTLLQLIQRANAEFETGDEEKAFVLYMGYAELAGSFLGKARGGTKECQPSFEDLEKAISRCEQLSGSLRQRYEEQARIEVELSNCPAPPTTALDDPLTIPEIPEAPENRGIPAYPMIPVLPHASSAAVPAIGPEPARTSSAGILAPDPVIKDVPIQKGPIFITSGELRDLLSNRQVLVLDIRSPEAFADSHISLSPDIINIPKVYPGITAHSIAETLSPQAKDLFNRRKNFQKIVIVDWECQNPSATYSKPYCVSEALKKWVPSEDAITCVHLKSGYKLWTMAFPHDTTNPMPDPKLNPSEGSENSAKLLSQVEEVRTLTWLPEKFEREVNVVPSPTVAPIVAPSSSKIPQPAILPTPDGAGDTAPSGAKAPAVEAKDVEPRPTSATKPGSVAPTASAVRRTDCSEISKIDQTSQDTIKQFTKAVNEKISVHKPRTLSEAESPRIDYRHPKTTLMRSRSMDHIYEESAHRDSFSRGVDIETKKPLFDRSLKPTQSLEAATVHQPVDAPQGVNNNTIERNNHIPSMGRGGDSNRHSGTFLASTTLEKVKPQVPPKNRRSQSPVQAYIYGAIDRTTGLRNLRNTCYLNSVVQALAHSIEFAQFFVRKEHLEHIREDSGRESLATLFGGLVAQLWSQTDTREVLTMFREQIGLRCPMYRSSDQQDSHEFLMSLLTVLHEDLNEAPKSNPKTSTDDPDLVVTFEMLPTTLNDFFVGHQDRQRSIVTTNFEGVLLSGLKCLTCEKDSYTFQVFTVLSVPVPSSWPQLDLQACFDQFFREETVEEWHCPHCKEKRSATKQMKIARLPKHLIIHLIRFKNEPWISSLASIKKVNNKVHFTEDLDSRDFAQYVYSKNVQLKSYTLYGIVKHHGTLSNGHYIAECRFLGKQAQPWYCYNDQEVTPLRNTIDVDNAYMLFYSCVKNS